MMSANDNLSADLNRYNSRKDMPKFQKWMRKYQGENNPIIKMIYKILFVYHRNKNCNEISGDSVIGGGIVYRPSIWHYYKCKCDDWFKL